ncbi:MAG: hypothetical protein WBA54_07630 [Acidaminobacteraceae bacterium]
MDQIIFSARSEELVEFNLENVLVKDEKVFLNGVVDYKTYRDVIKNEYFQFEEELVIESGFRNFDQDKEIEMSLRLENDLVELLAMNTELTNESIYKFLVDKSENEASNLFLMNESWYLLKVVQLLELPDELTGKGQLRMGFLTSWSI